MAMIRATREHWGIQMICGRSAMLMLIACIMLGASSHGSRITSNPAERVQYQMTAHAGTSTVWLQSPRLPRGATLSHFTPWKTRIKSVLEETKPRVIEECDLGPAILSGRFFSSATVELVRCPLPTYLPLRC
jgi:hypothetical protein